MNTMFHRFAQRTSAAVGSPWAFAAAVPAIVMWALTGPAVGFSTTWQLVINTATTIVTFLIVFLSRTRKPRVPGDPAEARRADPGIDREQQASTSRDVTDKQAAELLKTVSRARAEDRAESPATRVFRRAGGRPLGQPQTASTAGGIVTAHE